MVGSPTNWLKPTTIREKICMAQQDIGEPLYQAKTVGQFLRVMYDVCAGEYLVSNAIQGVLILVCSTAELVS